jgi:peptide/nickel transport system permease protein
MAIPVLIGISVIVFSMMHLAPGDAVDALLGPLRTPEIIERVRHELGLDLPIHVQYLRWVGRALTGDLGTSVRLSQPVLPEVIARLQKSAILAAAAFLLAVIIGPALGVISAVRRGRMTDTVITTTTVVGVSAPSFYLGMLVILVFSVKLSLLPMGGMYDVREGPSFGALLRHLIAPAMTLAAAPITVIVRMTRLSMLEVLSRDFIRTARAKGLHERRMLVRHAFRNAIVPVLNVIGLQIGYLLSATALVEVVFSWPGLGSLLVESVLSRDLPLLQGVVMMIAMVYLLVNILSDFTQAVLDRRIDFR